MTEYRRLREPGGTYFFTVVTYGRQPILIDPNSRSILRKVWMDVQTKHPFETVAVCLLTDHLHTIWKLPDGDTDYSMRWNEIKRHFTHEYLRKFDADIYRNESRVKRREQAIWQRRFWEHTFFDQDDLNAHIDYIHINPIKHGLVKRVADWPWSSFHRYVKMGVYPVVWGGETDCAIMDRAVGE
jgi:putative transposase